MSSLNLVVLKHHYTIIIKCIIKTLNSYFKRLLTMRFTHDAMVWFFLWCLLGSI